KGSYLKWIEETISEIIDLFIEKYNYIYDKNVKEPMAMIEGFKEWYLSNILKDTSAVIGLELIRRIVGLANVKDVTSILDEEKRIWAEKVCILAGKNFIVNRDKPKTGKDFVNMFKEVIVNVN